MKHLVQVLLPMQRQDGSSVAAEEFARVRVELTERFGGVTAYTRSPATGLWKKPDDAIERDQVIMVEVVVDQFDRGWWQTYRQELAARFGQEEIHARALAIELI
jgi:hypothetical protein